MLNQDPGRQIIEAIERHTRHVRPGEHQSPRTTLIAALAGMVLGVVALVLSLIAMTDDPASPSPSPSPSSRPWSEDCTAEELNTGVCYLTYDDIRNQPTYTQAP